MPKSSNLLSWYQSSRPLSFDPAFLDSSTFLHGFNNHDHNSCYRAIRRQSCDPVLSCFSRSTPSEHLVVIDSSSRSFLFDFVPSLGFLFSHFLQIAMATAEVTLPPSLVFLVSNFHSFVTIKLDGTNYLLWRIQIENVMRANGYISYLDGSSSCPPAQVTNSEGTLVPNTSYAL